MFGKIVVAVDGSEASTAALNFAVNLARQSGAALTGVFVVDGGWPDFIGNDWQSAKGARQGFLDYIRCEQEEQADAACRQFNEAANGCGQFGPFNFSVLAGDPTEILLKLANDQETGLLVTSRRVFQVSGRPSLKSLAKTLAQKASRPLLLVP